jgi:hypothetical protein
MKFDATLLTNDLGRMFAHESGHAIMATLKEIPYRGIAYDKDDPRFCTLTNITVQPSEHTQDHYLYFAAGVAAERIVCALVEQQEGGEHDKKFFENVGAPQFDSVVEQAQEILSKRKSTIEHVVSNLKTRVKSIKFDFDCLEEIVVGGKRYAILFQGQELKSAIESREHLSLS